MRMRRTGRMALLAAAAALVAAAGAGASPPLSMPPPVMSAAEALARYPDPPRRFLKAGWLQDWWDSIWGNPPPPPPPPKPKPKVVIGMAGSEG